MNYYRSIVYKHHSKTHVKVGLANKRGSLRKDAYLIVDKKDAAKVKAILITIFGQGRRSLHLDLGEAFADYEPHFKCDYKVSFPDPIK